MEMEDIPFIQALWKKVGFELSYSDRTEEIQRMIKYNPELCLIMKNDSNTIACVLGGFDGRRGWIHHLAVDPMYQNQGVGNQLMIHLMNIFDRMGVVKLKLEILRTNKSIIQFYQKIGWETRPDLITMSYTLRK